MTTLEQGASVTRKTKATIQHRPLVVTMHAEFLELRRFGKRESLTATYESISKLPRCAKLNATAATTLPIPGSLGLKSTHSRDG